MKALPLWQPWATLVAIGAKRVETRHFPPARIGLVVGKRIAIYATKSGPPLERTLDDEPAYLNTITRLADDEYGSTPRAVARALPRGMIVATCVLKRAAEMTATEIARLCEVDPEEAAFGHYEPGRWAWVLDDVRRLTPPVTPPPTGSRQGTFDWQPAGAATEPAQGRLL